MSRTDVHRPWLVQVADPYNRHRIHWYQQQPWAPAEESMGAMPLYCSCGCDMCTGRSVRRCTRRRERAAWRRLRQELLKDAAHRRTVRTHGHIPMVFAIHGAPVAVDREVQASFQDLDVVDTYIKAAKYDW